MRKAVAVKPGADFSKPDMVVSVTIDPETGYLATPACPAKRDEFYITGTEPTEYCPKHGGDPELLPDDELLDDAVPNTSKETE
jgi:membrane carboxypeptidase/penicillin-binding protein